MLNAAIVLFFAGWSPYYAYKSLKREKLREKLSGIASVLAIVFIIIGTRPPLNLRFGQALGLLGMSISLELLYLAYKEKSPFGYISSGIVAILGLYIFLSHVPS